MLKHITPRIYTFATYATSMSIINHHHSQEILHQLVLLLLPKQLWMLVVGGMVVQVASHRQPIQLPHVFLGMPSIVIIVSAIIAQS